MRLERNDYKDDLFKNLLPMSDEGDYIYWYNQNGQLELLTRKDHQTHVFPEEMKQGFGKKEAEESAEEWFKKVYEKEIKELGIERETVVSDFNGGNYLVTINQLHAGKQTGNTASISISAEGEVISAAFVHNTLSPEELLKPIMVDENDALERAVKAVDRDLRSTYNYFISDLDETEVISSSYRVFRGLRFWEFEINVPVASEKGEVYEPVIYCYVRIDADTGECIEIASPLK